MTERLRRSARDRLFAGVCGGLAVHYAIDPTLVRLAFVVLALIGGIGVLLYLALMLLMPGADASGVETTMARDPDPQTARNRELLGIELVLVGALWLVAATGVLRAIPWQYVWPLALVAAGVVLLVQSRRA